MTYINLKNFDFNLVEIILNNSCPLDCDYCFLHNTGQSSFMNVNTLINTFLFCKESMIQNPRDFISIMFSLKEPLVSWKTIQTALEKINFNLQDYNIYCTINTNGVLLTDEIANYCIKNNIDVHISLDGPKEIHDKRRIYRYNQSKSSWDKVIQLIKYPNFSFMTTLHKEDINNILDIFNFMSSLSHTWIYSLDNNDKWDLKTISKLESQIKQFIINATPQQLQYLRIADTAASFPNLLVTNSIKVLQNGDITLQPPIHNEGATQGYFTSQVQLGNVNNKIEIPQQYVQLTYKDFNITNLSCKGKQCPVYTLCKQNINTNKQIFIDDFACVRLAHFQRMSHFAKGDYMTDLEYQNIRNSTPIYNGVINVTDACNLNCEYCFTHPNPRTMDLGTMKAAISFLTKDIDRFPEFKKSLGINFFGGEPMLCFENIIKPTILWTEETGLRDKYKISFGMTSNGTLFNEENLLWLYQHNCAILLSIDGDKPTQDSQRCTKQGSSSFDILQPILPLILKYFPDTTFRSTIQPYNIDKLYENYLFARKNNFKNYFVTPNLEIEWTFEQYDIMIKQLSLIAETIYRDISLGYEPLIYNDFLANLLGIFFDNNEETAHNIGYHHCGIGTSSIGISCDGSLNGCQEHNTYLKKDIFYIGDVFTGIDPIKHKRLLSAYANIKQHPVCKDIPELCSICSFYTACASSFCPSHNILNNNELFENTLTSCLWKKSLRDIALIILEQAAAEHNQIFINYLENQIINQTNPEYQGW